MALPYEYIEEVSYKLAFFADDQAGPEGLILLTRLVVDSQDVPLQSAEQVDKAQQDHPWLERVIRRLELTDTDRKQFPDGPVLHVNPEVLKILGGEGKTVLQMLSFPLGRCEYEGGLFWFSGTEQVVRAYEHEYEPKQAAGRDPRTLNPLFLEELYEGVTDIEGSWLMTWRPCVCHQTHIQMTSAKGIQHAGVMVSDALGYTGLGSVAIRARGPVDLHNAFGEAYRQAIEDVRINRASVLVRVSFSEEEYRDYLLDLTNRGNPPLGYEYFGWQPSEGRTVRASGRLGIIGTQLADAIVDGMYPERTAIEGVSLTDLNMKPLLLDANR